MNDNIEERISVKTKDLIKEIKETLTPTKINEIKIKPLKISSNIDKSNFLDKIC